METVTPFHEAGQSAGESTTDALPADQPISANTFPFSIPPDNGRVATDYLWSHIPLDQDDAQFLIDAYYRHMGWK